MRGFADLFLRKVCQFRKSDSAVYHQVGPYRVQVHVLSSNTATCTHVSDSPESPCESFHEGCSGLKVSYLANMKCENGTGHLANGYDYIIANCGHHPAAAEHFTYLEYTSKVNNFLLELHQHHRRTRLFWLENTAPPLRQVF